MLTRALFLIALLTAMAVPAHSAEQSLGGKIKKIFDTDPHAGAAKEEKLSEFKEGITVAECIAQENVFAGDRGRITRAIRHRLNQKEKIFVTGKRVGAFGAQRQKQEALGVGIAKCGNATKEKIFANAGAGRNTIKVDISKRWTGEFTGIAPEKHGAPNATLAPGAIKGFEDYPANVQKLLASALELTTRDLGYTYGSADPANGGMDCSGFVYFVLKQNGVSDVPRDSSEQYIWLRRARRFEAVLSQKEDSFELEDLKPGDLLFWTGTYSIERDPPITHAMIFLGREKKTGQRVMVRASDGRVYQGQSRNGVSVFDFKIQPNGKTDDGRLRPTFVGYGHIPGF